MSRLLVIDEDSGRRLILRSRLADAGFEFVLAETGARGLVEARNGPFDAILVDARLASGVDGPEVCRRLKAIPEGANVPVVVFVDDTSNAEEMLRAYESGCDAFVSRAEMPSLEHVLRALARQRARIDELRGMLQALNATKVAAPTSTPLENVRRPAHAERNDCDAALAAEQSAALRELAGGRPDGVLIVDAGGLVCHADRGACELLGSRVEGSHLGSLIPASGLEAFVRDAAIEAREGLRFDLPARRGRAARPMIAVVVPMLTQAREETPALRVVELHDGLRRRIAAEALRVHEPALPKAEAAPIIEAARELYRPHGLLGTSEQAQRLREAVAFASTHHDAVLLVGEPGTGRRRIARIIHWSGTSIGHFVEIRCGAHSAENLEAELFGTARTSTSPERPGRIHMAQDGTLHLHEVGDLPSALQARLLHFLESGFVQRRGAQRDERLDVRILATTGASLQSAVASGRFLPKLLERLARHEIEVPRLADRPADVEALVAACVVRFGAARSLQGATPPALAALRAHAWPGNVAELEACLEHACAHATGTQVTLEDLPRAIREQAGLAARDELTPRPAPKSEQRAGTHTAAGLPASEVTPAPKGKITSSPEAWAIPLDEPVSLGLYERQALLRAIAECNGDKIAAAKKLKLGKSTMYRKMKRYGII